jgi:hypothetical protein
MFMQEPAMQTQSIEIVGAEFSGALLGLDLRQDSPAARCRQAERSPVSRPHVFEIDGALVGAAVRLDTGYRFMAADLRLEELDGTTWPSLADLQRLAHLVFRTSAAAAPDAFAASPPAEALQS